MIQINYGWVLPNTAASIQPELYLRDLSAIGIERGGQSSSWKIDVRISRPKTDFAV